MRITDNNVYSSAAQYEPQAIENHHEGQSNPRVPGIYNMKDWLNLELSADEKEIIIGTAENAIIRPKTKNLIEAAEKSFKTTFLLRLLGGLSCGETVYPELHVVRPRRVLYLHGELSTPEIKERTRSLAESLESKSFTNFWQGRVLGVHLIEDSGRKELRRLIEAYAPDDVALDPWQSFISGSEENTYKDMSDATAFCGQLIEEYGITLWIPIHLGKDRSKGPRGHSVISGWRDTKIQLARNQGHITVNVEPRWGTPPDPFRLRFRNGTLWPDDSAAVLTGQDARIRQYVVEHGGKVDHDSLRDHLQLAPDAYRKALDRAQQRGVVVKGRDYVLLPLDDRSDSDEVSVV